MSRFFEWRRVAAIAENRLRAIGERHLILVVPNDPNIQQLDDRPARIAARWSCQSVSCRFLASWAGWVLTKASFVPSGNTFALHVNSLTRVALAAEMCPEDIEIKKTKLAERHCRLDLLMSSQFMLLDLLYVSSATLLVLRPSLQEPKWVGEGRQTLNLAFTPGTSFRSGIPCHL